MKARRRLCVVVGTAVVSVCIGGCASYPGWIASAGPSGEQMQQTQRKLQSAIRLVDVDDTVASRILASENHPRFAETFAPPATAAPLVGPGDVIEVSIWEAPPALLLGSVVIDSRVGTSVARGSALPEQMVAVDGSITVPFVGAVNVAGKSLHEIEAEIARRLSGKANQPQVLVRVTHNASANVTVVGEVAQSIRMPLTAKGEHLLDAIAAAGGVRQPVGKMTVQITRGEQVKAMPLERVIQSPNENVALLPGDVVTLMFQPLSFTVLGATAKNEEISFEAQGISLAQALARAGGIQDSRGDARGVFVFRFEDRQALAEAQREGPTTPDGRVPVVYRLDMKNPASFLVAQNFPIRNRDVVYVSNAPSSELQKFLNILTSSLFSTATLINLGNF